MGIFDRFKKKNTDLSVKSWAQPEMEPQPEKPGFISGFEEPACEEPVCAESAYEEPSEPFEGEKQGASEMPETESTKEPKKKWPSYDEIEFIDDADPAETEELFQQAKELAEMDLEYDEAGSARMWKLFWEAGRRNHPGALYELGFEYEYSDDIERDVATAAKLYLRAANLGDEGGQLGIASCYEHGDGVEKDEAEALRWYLEAAKQGNAFAMYCVGYAYQMGEGTDKDEAEGFRWCLKGANLGDSSCMENVSWAYRHGRGVEKNEELADYWSKQADAAWEREQEGL